MKNCRSCGHQVAEDAIHCPGCGAPHPAKEKWDGYGWEFKTKTRIMGLPLLHISFKYRATRVPVPARGIIAIGQFAAGGVTISQFGIGVFSVSQFTLAYLAVAQFAAAWSGVAQFGVFLSKLVGG